MLRSPTYANATETSSAMVTLGLTFAPREPITPDRWRHDPARPAFSPIAWEKSKSMRVRKSNGHVKKGSDSDEEYSTHTSRRARHCIIVQDSDDDELCLYNRRDSCSKVSSKHHKDDDGTRNDKALHMGAPVPQIVITDFDVESASTQSALSYLVSLKPSWDTLPCLRAQDPFIASRLASVTMALARAGHFEQARGLAQFGTNLLGTTDDGTEI